MEEITRKMNIRLEMFKMKWKRNDLGLCWACKNFSERFGPGLELERMEMRGNNEEGEIKKVLNLPQFN